MMRATVVTRSSETSFTTTQPWDVNTARLAGFAEPSHFSF
jgi:protein-L-isoaspartate(D-aspartate) O-methyltransferase